MVGAEDGAARTHDVDVAFQPLPHDPELAFRELQLAVRDAE
jgi:hypothetical protein